jgi:hypothetical protein
MISGRVMDILYNSLKLITTPWRTMTNERRKTRSSGYQWILVEKAFSHDMMETFSNDDGIQKKLNPYHYNEDILVLEDQLKERFWEIINENLTDRQLQIVELLKSGATQQETAKKLQVNQSSITKCLSSETELYFTNDKITISDLWNTWQTSPAKVKSMSIKCLNEDTKEVIETSVVDVMRGDEKPLISFTTTSGKNIRASADHKFFTSSGWRRLEEIINGELDIAVSINDAIQFDKIKSYKDDGIEITYDIEVVGPYHNFIANDIITHNSLNGNVDYANGSKASYGGICKKLQKIVLKDSKIKDLVQKISDIRNNTYF